MRAAIGAVGLLLIVVANTATRDAAGQTSQPGVVINRVLYPALERERKPKRVIPPLYPEKAMRKQLDGFVDFEFTIQPDGSVQNPRVMKEFPEHLGFAKNAEKVFGGFTFEPDVVNGVPVTTSAQYRMVFKYR